MIRFGNSWRVFSSVTRSDFSFIILPCEGYLQHIGNIKIIFNNQDAGFEYRSLPESDRRS